MLTFLNASDDLFSPKRLVWMTLDRNTEASSCEDMESEEASESQSTLQEGLDAEASEVEAKVEAAKDQVQQWIEELNSGFNVGTANPFFNLVDADSYQEASSLLSEAMELNIDYHQNMLEEVARDYKKNIDDLSDQLADDLISILDGIDSLQSSIPDNDAAAPAAAEATEPAAEPAEPARPAPAEPAAEAPPPPEVEAIQREITDSDGTQFLEIEGTNVEDWIENIATKYETTLEQIQTDNPGKIKKVTQAGGGFEVRHIGKHYVLKGETLKIRKGSPAEEPAPATPPDELAAATEETAPGETIPAPGLELKFPRRTPHLEFDRSTEPAESASAPEPATPEPVLGTLDGESLETGKKNQEYREGLARHMETTFPGLTVSAESIQIFTADEVDGKPRKARMVIDAIFKGKAIHMEGIADPSNIDDPVKAAKNQLLHKLSREIAMQETEETGEKAETHKADMIRNLERRYPKLTIQIKPEDIHIFVSNRVDGRPQDARVRLQATVNGVRVALEAKGSASDMIDSHYPVNAASRSVILGLLPEYKRVKALGKKETPAESTPPNSTPEVIDSPAPSSDGIILNLPKKQPHLEWGKTPLPTAAPVETVAPPPAPTAE